MRTWGRLSDGTWVAVTTTADGDDTPVWITTLIQTLKLEQGESPFYAQYGIAARQSIVSQIAPDYSVSMIQQQFSAYFASLSIQRVPNTDAPTYAINAITLRGQTIFQTIAV